MTRFKRIAAATAVLAAGLLAASVATAGPAMAGQDKKLCKSDMYVAGASYSSGAYTTKPHATECGDVGVRAFYQLYSGSPIYYAAWSYGTVDSASQRGNTILGGNHKTSAPYSGYDGNFPFST
ncbi:hypothetical protein ASE14_00215 [Agromyces sp. Root81]|uniref:hypothetical protein n=1 Tax=Agromyces sp. Root81 TaxID=1736601 RepID=UPI0006F35181|nr:hypothetical protein [Agromyces sp. Root81]KRC62317.1 hypothetical protein ASE14_00215 [Agromyces sp. Root81]